ncbi:response regulator transcription factor [Clostridium sediminicola]|uniref:response regulator n=1 Tax=Clostridium sediminicola TaxID=3114879 RepID=UPI0031F25B5E
MSEKIRIIIADDDPLIRDSLKIILGMDEKIDVIKTVENGAEAVESCRRNSIDIALLDVRMPVMNGVDAVKEITKFTKTRTIILTTFDEDEYIRLAILNGAKGYLLKNNSPDKIINAIKTVYGGNTVMQDLVIDKLKNGINDNYGKFDKSNFTQRELEIIKAVSEGYSNKEISEKLYISEGTVKNYISNILSKTGLKHRTQIAINYLRQ